MMHYYVIADTHFYHKNVIKYSSRPFKDVSEMNETLIKKWNAVVKSDDDIVFVLGDFSLTGKKLTSEIVKRLRGRKVLIMGNHDSKKPKYYIECGFNSATHYPILFENKFILSHIPLPLDKISDNYIYIYGHVHNKPSHLDSFLNCICVSVERMNYEPVLLDEKTLYEKNLAYQLNVGIKEAKENKLKTGKEVMKEIKDKHNFY